jgi:hypothetical protein
MNNKWISNHINPWWDKLHQVLNYKNEPFNNLVDLEKWQSIGFTHKRFTGDMYDMRNPAPNWMDLERLQKEFKFKHLSWSFYCMKPGVILPEHVDTFNRFKELYNTENKVIVRALIMLEDWQQGHYLDMNRVASTNWKAGDYYVWEEDCPHTAANIGTTNRYTLQLTGLIDNRLC